MSDKRELHPGTMDDTASSFASSSGSSAPYLAAGDDG